MTEFKPAPIHIIKDLDAAKSIADPLRVQILEVLIPAPQTVNQIAARLGLASSKLYYHVNTLERYGLIQVVDTSIHGNIIEKHYWVTANEFRLDHELYNFNVTDPEGKQNILSMTLTTLDIVREDFIRSIEARAFNLERGAEPHPRRVLNTREISHISDEKMAEFHTRLQALVEEFIGMDDPSAETSHPWALNIFLYPSFYYDSMESTESIGQE